MTDYHAFTLFGAPAMLFGLYLAAPLLGPLVVDRSVGIEIGKYRIGYARHGWSFQYDWRRRHDYSISGLWPWYKPPEIPHLTINKSDKLPAPVMIIHWDGSKEYNI